MSQFLRVLPLALLVSVSAHADDFGVPRSPEETAALIVSAPHGLSPMSGREVLDALEEAERTPEVFVPLLAEFLRPGRVSTAPNPNEAVRQGATAAFALARLGEPGRAALANAWRELQSSADAEEQVLIARGKVLARPQHPELVARRRSADRLMALQSAALTALASAKDARLRDELLLRFDRETFSRQLKYIEYFDQTARGVRKVQEKLRPYYESPESHLHHSPRLRALLDASAPIDGGTKP